MFIIRAIHFSQWFKTANLDIIYLYSPTELRKVSSDVKENAVFHNSFGTFITVCHEVTLSGVFNLL